MRAAAHIAHTIYPYHKVAFGIWKDTLAQSDQEDAHIIVAVTPSAWMKLRNWLRIEIVETTGWEIGSFSLVLGSCVLLALQNPTVDPDSEHAKLLGSFDLFFTIVFCVEAILKIAALTVS